jgi:hypothetical protein
MYWFGWVYYFNGFVLFLSYDLTKDNAQDIQILCFSLHSLSLQFYSSQSPTIFTFSFLSWENKVIALTLCLSIFTSANYLQPEVVSLSLSFLRCCNGGALLTEAHSFFFIFCLYLVHRLNASADQDSEWMRCLTLTRYLSTFT